MKNLKYFIRLTVGILSYISLPIYYVVGALPRERDIWLFGAWQGNQFRGKVKYFYDYVRMNHESEVLPVWVTKNKDVISEIRSNNGVAFYMYSFKGLYYHLRASNYFVSHGVGDFVPFLSRGSKITKLGHATYHYKNIQIDDALNRLSFLEKLDTYIMSPYTYCIKNHLSYEVISSEYTGIRSGSEALNPSIVKLPFGSIKGDYLSSLKMDKEYFFRKFLGSNTQNFKKIIVFFPTWRRSDSFSIFSNDFALERIERLLRINECLMIVSFHPVDVAKRLESVPESKYIISVNSEMDDTNRLLSVADIFITDYSSLFADFLVFKKPIVFARFNNEEYINEDKGNINVDEIESLPGPQVMSWSELEHVIESIFLNSINYIDEINRWHSMIYGDGIGSARKKIFNFIRNKDRHEN